MKKLLCFISLAWAAFALHAQQGSLDPTFANGGIGRYSFTPESDATIPHAFMVQPDGKIILGGVITTGSNTNFAILRLNSDGTLDNSFSGDGKFTLDLRPTEYLMSFAIRPDGKIVCAGWLDNSGSGNDGVVFQLTTDGNLDNSFSGDGIQIVSMSNGYDRVYAIRLQPDAKIVGVGPGNNGMMAFRLNTDGSPDLSFGVNGFKSTATGSQAYACALQPDGKVLIGGSFPFTVMRLNTDGSFDNSFSGDGKQFAFTSTTSEVYPHGLALQPDGKIVATGFSNNSTAVVRLNPDGSFDNSFSDDGQLTIPIGRTFDAGFGVAVLPSGKIMVGTRNFSGSGRDFALIRLNANGTLDNSFDGDGIATTGSPNFNEVEIALAMQTDGKILLAGYGPSAASAKNQFIVMRFIGESGFTLTCPGNQNVNAPSGTCTGVVNGISPTISPAYNGDTTYTLSGATTGSGSGDVSGTVFNKGVTAVTYTLPALGLTCSFNVTVNASSNIYYLDSDGDGFGDAAHPICDASPTPPTNYVTNKGDCNDNNAAINPNTVWYKDTDNDGYSNGTSQVACSGPIGYKTAAELTATTGDCNDNDAAIKPGATEIPDGKDNNCNGETDEGFIVRVQSSNAWKATATQFSGWETTGYDDGAWSAALSPSPGDFGICSNNPLTMWGPTGNRTVYLRQHVFIPGNVTAITYRQFGVDDDADVYINGTRIINNANCIAADLNLKNLLLQHLKPGDNVIAIKAVDCGGCYNMSVDFDIVYEASQNISSTVPSTAFCAGSTFNVAYTATGTYNAGNIFTAQLSNAAGSFTSPTTIGTVAATTSGNISATIPEGTTPGTQYRIRVVASNPIVTGNDNGSNISISASPLTYYLDADGDGFGDPSTAVTVCSPASNYVLNSSDCNDNNAAIKPTATEVCDGIDNNCNGQTDEGFGPITTWYKDSDNDSYSNGATQVACSRPVGYKTPAELTATTGDCNDNSAAVNSAAPEICDGIDNNCNSQTDEGLATTWYKDTDNDGYSDGTTQVGCTRPTGYKTAAELTATSGDCNDNNSSIHPGAGEICGNGADDNCNGQTDEGVITTWYKDSDNDNYGDGLSKTACSRPAGYKTAAELITTDRDCDDNNAAINPATNWYKDMDNDGFSDGKKTQTRCSRPDGYKLASELSATSGDCDDADADVNPATVWYKDRDNDGYSDGVSHMGCKPNGVAYKLATALIAITGDCKDNDASIHPGAAEPTDGIDNDCNGIVDDACMVTWWLDGDGDGFGRPQVSRLSCTRPDNYVDNADDCDDTNADIHEGATEQPDGRDNNCNGQVDEGLACLKTWYLDGDSDGYGRLQVTKLSCVQPDNYVDNADDCDDANAAVYEGAPELPDDKDNDCNGQVDDGLACQKTWYKDSDNDGYGDGLSKTQCSQPAGYKLASELVTTNNDCDDNNAAINPGTIWYKDADGDGYSDGKTQTRCTRPADHKLASELSATSGDCNDSDAAINPNTLWYKDRDNDGYSDGVSHTGCQPNGAAYKLATALIATSGDCKDNDAIIYPGASEAIDGIDNDCNGIVDDPCMVTWYLDADGDGYGRPQITKLSCTQPAGYVSNELDCRDYDAAIHPGATELPDGLDNNCNGQADEGLPCLKTWYGDADRDGYGKPQVTKLSCVKPGDDYVDNALDCRDFDAATHPGAVEKCDGIDNDCDGTIDEGCTSPAAEIITTPKAAIKLESHEAITMQLWPNPARDELTVALSGFDPAKKVSLTLVQSDGKPVLAKELVPGINGTQVRMNVRAVAAGFYMVRASQGALTKTEKVVIQR